MLNLAMRVFALLGVTFAIIVVVLVVVGTTVYLMLPSGVPEPW